jgi:glutamine amidotransferase
MKLIIIDYGSGNLRSVENAFKKAISDNSFGINIEVTNNLQSLRKGDFLVLPGVGSFPDCSKGLKAIDGLVETLSEEVIYKEKPFLGICVGMQLMVDYSLEKIKTSGFGWLKGYLSKIESSGKDYLGRRYKIPHMGWNNLKILNKSYPILKNISEKEQFYFVHSYYLTKSLNSEVLASTHYAHEIPAIIGKKNYYGVQFHPEKSSFAGQKFISNWIKL